MLRPLALVAQWIEYWPPKPGVVGSIPAERTKMHIPRACVSAHPSGQRPAFARSWRAVGHADGKQAAAEVEAGDQQHEDEAQTHGKRPAQRPAVPVRSAPAVRLALFQQLDQGMQDAVDRGRDTQRRATAKHVAVEVVDFAGLAARHVMGGGRQLGGHRA